MMTLVLTCNHCGSGNHIFPFVDKNKVECEICNTCEVLKLNIDHERGVVQTCPKCSGRSFYKQNTTKQYKLQKGAKKRGAPMGEVKKTAGQPAGRLAGRRPAG